MKHTITCDECGGTGNDPGGLSATEKTDCLVCDGTGTIHTDYEVGDVVEYRHDETGALIIATVMGYGIPGWLEVHDEGTTPEDDADIHVSLIVRVVGWTEYLNDQRKVA